MINSILNETDDKMDKSVESTREEFSAIRAGRANPNMFSKINVDYYGTPTPLQQLASFSTPEARIVLISPFDRGSMNDIEKAIRSSPELGLSPQSDGEMVRLPIPQLTEERRKEFTKLTKSKGEEAKVAVRNARRDANERVKKHQKDGEIPDDAAKKLLDRVQQATDKRVKVVDDMVAKKDKEILEI